MQQPGSSPAGMARLAHAVGLHPLVALVVILVDMMLFGGEMASVGVTWPISVGVAAVLLIPCTLIQRNAYGDSLPWRQPRAC